MRVLIFSDLAATGFGRVGRELGAGLLARGHDVKVIGINWRGVDGELVAAMGEGSIDLQSERLQRRLTELRADPLTDRIMPASRGGDGMGYALTAPAIRGILWPGWKPEAVIIVADPRAMWDRLRHDAGSLKEARDAGVIILNYVPIEGTGLPEAWRMMWDFAEPVAMSDFGGRQLETLLGRPITVAYHGRSEAFHQVAANAPGSWRGEPVTSKDGAKRAIGCPPDRTLILRTDRFVFRKNYPAWFRVLEPIVAKHPEVACVAHTVPLDDMGQGTLWELISRVPGAQMIGVDQGGTMIYEHPQFRLTGWHDSWTGLSDADLNVLYNAADLVVTTTMGEGFGMTNLEAISCGVPVVATDCSAVSEVVGPGGILIPARDTLTCAYAHEWALIDEQAATAAVERLISKPALRRELGAAGRRHAARFTWSACVDQFHALLSRPAAIAA